MQHENTELMQTKLYHQDFSLWELDLGRNRKPMRTFEFSQWIHFYSKSNLGGNFPLELAFSS